MMKKTGTFSMEPMVATKASMAAAVDAGVEHKNLSVETKILSEDEGIVQMVVSATNIKDYVDDIIEPGAYSETLLTRNPKGVYQHDMALPVAKTLHALELMPGDPRLPAQLLSVNAGGLLITAQFNLNTQRGREAFEEIKFYGDEQEYSIGFVVPTDASRIDNSTGTRYITKIDLFEWSPVTFGAAPGTGTTFVKSYSTGHESLVGSYEALSYRIREAITPQFATDDKSMTEVEIVGTFTDKVIIEVAQELSSTYYEIPYSEVDGGGIKFGTIKEVVLGSVVVDKDHENDLEIKADPKLLKAGSYVQWEVPNGSAYGRVVQIKRDGILTAGVFGKDIGIEGTKENPACLIQVYATVEGEWKGQSINAVQSAESLLLLSALPSREAGQEKAAMGTDDKSIEQKDTALVETGTPAVSAYTDGVTTTSATTTSTTTNLTEPVTEVVTEPVAEPVVEVVTEPVTEAVTEVVTEPVTEVVAEVVTEAVTTPEVVTEPVVEPTAEVVTEVVPTPETETPAELTASVEDVIAMLAEMVDLNKFALRFHTGE